MNIYLSGVLLISSIITSACDSKISLSGNMNADSRTASEPTTQDSKEKRVKTMAQPIDPPVSVAGSFLTCTRLPWIQGEGPPKWDCLLGGISRDSLDKIEDIEITASFYKVKNETELNAMTIIDFDRNTLLWTIQENLISSTNIIQGAFSINETAFTVITDSNDEVAPPLTMDINPNLWVAGEPSSDNENCVEFWPTETQQFAASNSPTNGKLNDTPCNDDPLRFVCRNLSNPQSPLILSETTGMITEHNEACPEGYAFSFPTSIQEAKDLGILVDATLVDNIPQEYTGVWVALIFNENRQLTFYE